MLGVALGLFGHFYGASAQGIELPSSPEASRLAHSSPTGDSALFRLSEPRGPYAVGLRVVEQYDRSRLFAAAKASPESQSRFRPLQTLIWYPALRSDGKAMTFGDYVALESTEISFGHPQKATGQEAEHLAAMAPSYGTPLSAVRDARVAGGHFPVIIYAPSFSQVPWENADLCEYIASFGYTVLAVPAMGIGPESTHDVAGTNEQARDISFLLDYAKSLPGADLSEVAVVGYSWGGLANLFVASRDSRIRALVALDGSMRYFPGIVKDAGDVHPDKMTIPLLYFKAQHSLEDQDALEAKFHDPGPNVINDWGPGDLIAVSMLGLVHPEFSSRAQRNEDIWKNEMANLQEADYRREDGMIGYGWMARYTREFLDNYLKHSAAATQFLKRTPSENGVPPHVMYVTFKTQHREK